MENYLILTHDGELNYLIDSINEKNRENLFACHGRYHTTFVVNTIETILTKLGFDTHTVELGKISGLLHDIGAIQGKKGHAKRSSEMCIDFLDKTNLSKEDKKIVIHAILDHSNGDEITSPVGAALLLADKINLSKDRVLELGKKDRWHSNLLNIDDMILTIENNNIIINYIVNDKFSKDILLEEWTKGITAPMKASNYLGVNCFFEFNGKRVDLISVLK